MNLRKQFSRHSRRDLSAGRGMILTDYAISDNSYVKFMNILKPALVSTSLLFVSAAQAFSSVALPVTSVISHIRSEFNSSEAYQSTSSITLYSIDTAQECDTGCTVRSERDY